MTDRKFHDAILKENAIPIEMVRALLSDSKLTPDWKPEWKFYAGVPKTREVGHAGAVHPVRAEPRRRTP